MERDNTLIKKRKEEVVDVLANIKSAVNFVDKIYAKESPQVSKHNSLKVSKVEVDDSDDEVPNSDEEDKEA